ncbi:AraC family ligand binding domain-containing protein, partial [Sphingomonas bacterium]|uniref:AraC family ligand binding domain-containing protein n=1 Tax=Sphingomonas bacterium TaxID=1895847 RepID=UPI001575EDFD
MTTAPDDTRRLIGAETSQAVSAHGVELVTDGYEEAPHRHARAQLILGISGMITCTVADGLWMVPPGCAVWIPGGTEHSVRAAGKLELYILKVDEAIAPDLPTQACTITVSPLLRELVIEVARTSPAYDEAGPAGRLIGTMLDRLATAPIERLHLPLPSDPRLRRIADAITADPSDRSTIGEWARRVGLSERTLFRLVPEQTGMTFG